jgi:hypothetical protein
MEAPDHIVQGLKGVKAEFNLRWNPRARYVSGSSYDVNGNPRTVVYDPRWELWDRDDMGIAHKVMTLEDAETGGFMPPGEWLLQLVRLIDPARYGGDVGRMTKALVDDHNESVRKVAQKDWERLVEAVGSYYTPARGGSMVTRI